MFSAFFIRRPKFAMVISLAIMLAGGICYFNLPVAEYPEVAPPQIVVSTNYSGASAQTVADTIAAPIEEQVNGVEDLLYYSSTSGNNGAYQLSLIFDPSVDPDIAMVNVNNAIKRAERALPPEVVMSGIRVSKRTADFLGIVAFTSDNADHTPLFLSNYVSNNIRDAVTRVDGVGQAMIFGELRYSMRVWLDPIRMDYFGISQAEVLAAVRAQNIQAATGSVGTEAASNYMQFKVETRGRLREVAEFSDIVIRSTGRGRNVLLSDIADIQFGAENYSGTPTLNGKPAVMLAILKLSDANAMQIIEDVHELIDSLEPTFPEGMEWQMAYDTTLFIEATMEEIIFTLVLTFVLVMIITYIFLQDWRATLIPMVAIPISIIGTFMFMQMLGLSMNTLTMFGLILAIGSVVDDAIVVVETCMRLMEEEGISAKEAAFRAMNELSGVLVAATLVVVAVYAPLAFYAGMVGTIYQQFAITICISLCLSLVVALTLSPALCALVLRKHKAPKGPFKAFNFGLNFVRNRYLNVGGFLARRALLALILLGGILFANYKLYGLLPPAFLPEEDKGNILCEIALPSGASLARTQEALTQFGEQLREVEEIQNTMLIPGRGMISGDGENIGMIFISLTPWADRKTKENSAGAVVNKILAMGMLTMPEARVLAFNPPPIQGLGATGGVSFALQATGDQTPQELADAVDVVHQKIAETGKAAMSMSSFDVKTPMLYLDIDRAKAEAMGVSTNSIFNTLQTQLGSMYVNDFNLYGKTYRVIMQSDAGYRENKNFIDQLTVPSSSGAYVPINSVASMRWVVGPRQVERFNMFPAANVKVSALPGVSSGEMMQTITDVVRTNLPNDYQVAWTELSYQEAQNKNQIGYIMALAIVFAYLFLVAQYESWTTPISVLLSVSTATAGSMAVLMYLGRSMDIYCQLGLLMLVGLVSKTVILMVEYAKKLRDEGQDLREAAVNGLKIRFRAVMMTALSLVIGVSPLVVATGAGAGSRRSIGVTAFWGMVIATVVGVAIVPSLYVITRSMSETTKRICGRLFGMAKKHEEPKAPTPVTPPTSTP